MKKTLLAALGLVLTFAIANAQTDTTKVVPFTTRKTDSTALSSSPRTVADPSKDMIKVPTNQIPASLRSTLAGTEYKGWENNGVIFQNPGTSEYALQLNPVVGVATTTVPIWYRFDGNGKRIPEPKN